MTRLYNAAEDGELQNTSRTLVREAKVAISASPRQSLLNATLGRARQSSTLQALLGSMRPWHKYAIIIGLILLALSVPIIFCPEPVFEQLLQLYKFAGTSLLSLAMLAIFGALYFIPAIVGRHKKNAGAIMVTNLFLGWTGLGWIIALIWATTKD